jgi:hypoxanthine phosphoribosyltransferase
MAEVGRVLYGREDVRRRVAELGRTITGDYVGREPVFVTVLKGGAVFLADLVRAIDLPLEVSFMAISRYGDAEESLGRVQILLDVELDLAGRDVVLVEDIVDTGLTSRYLLSVLKSRGAASVECPDSFVVGYGLDFRERYRNLPDILQVDDLAALRADPDVLTSSASPAA